MKMVGSDLISLADTFWFGIYGLSINASAS
jgi:hypothetical protein